MDPRLEYRKEPPMVTFLRMLLLVRPERLYLVVNLAEYSRCWGRGRPIRARNTAIGASTFAAKFCAGDWVALYPAAELNCVHAIFPQSKWPVAPVGRGAASGVA